jgi:hypothetical protein
MPLPPEKLDGPVYSAREVFSFLNRSPTELFNAVRSFSPDEAG